MLLPMSALSAHTATRHSSLADLNPAPSKLMEVVTLCLSAPMVSAPPAWQGFSPLDDELGLLPGQLTPRLQEGLVRLSTHIPSFAKAAKEFAFFTQVELQFEPGTMAGLEALAPVLELARAD